jgi:hypothetical protein
MSAYKSRNVGTIAFDGAEVPYELKRISYEDYLTLTKVRKESESHVSKQSLELLRGYVVSIDVKDADEKPVPIDTIFSDFYFASLVGALTGRLLETGSIPKAKQGPSDGNSSEPSAAASSQQA